MIHGVRSVDPLKRGVGRLAPAFRSAGFCVTVPQYGFIPAFAVGILQRIDDSIASTIGSFLQPNDILLGHSNGAALTYLIAKHYRIRGAILINAALDSEHIPDCDWVHVYYNSGDWITRLASMIPFHVWGDMGAVGYTGTHRSTVINVDCGHPPEPDLPVLSGHNAIFQPGNTAAWARFMAGQTVRAIAAQPRPPGDSPCQ